MARRFDDLTGQRFGKLVVLRQDGRAKDGRTMWLCKCDCGNTTSVTYSHLIDRHTQSCGCLRKTCTIIKNKNRATHKGSRSRLYYIWVSAKDRCFNKNNHGYNNYGGRGITMCEEWESSFEAFRDWAYENGYDENAPKGQCTLDRIDVNGNYEPNNCRFVDIKTQQRNRTSNNRIVYNGEIHTLVEWAELFEINYATLNYRINTLSWPVERAFTEPAHKKHRRK